ncbi:hypothetical protein ACFW0H_06710 [Pseudomonas sp. CR3202]|uniref:hypothetical protein n=1 Tax=Pseudomonas sp. CR3202 TaxID=3351532 RepID=UPI003BF06A6E
MPYIYFDAEQYEKYQVLTANDIQALKNGATLLSVGIGPGDYEEYLIKSLGVPPSSIHCADLALHQKWSSHIHHSFDICDPWPPLKHLYDYILFGQVIGISAHARGYTNSIAMDNHVCNVINEAAPWLQSGGQIVVFDTTIQTMADPWHIPQDQLWNKVANSIKGKITRNRKEWFVVNITV